MIVEISNKRSKLYIGNIYRHNNGPSRNYTVDQLSQWTDILNNNIIVCGDWNSTPGEIQKLFANRLLVHYHSGKGGTRINSRYNVTDRKVDFTMSSPSIHVNSIKKHILSVSDHMAMITDIKFNWQEKRNTMANFNRVKLKKINKK